MGRKKATSLKADTKALLNAHIDAASAVVTAPRAPNSSLFFVDKSAAAAPSKAKSQSGKRKRAADVADNADAMDESAGAASAAAAAASATAAAAAAHFHDSDDEEVGLVSKNKFQRAAEKQKQTKLVSERESKRLKAATQTKAEKEAAAAAAKPKLFDLWATTLEEDLKQGIVPATDAKGFRVARTQQTRFRHSGAEQGKAHLKAAKLPAAIHEGASFHPDFEAHQELLRKAHEKDQKERDELRAIHARFHVPPERLNPAPASAATEDDSWMDDGEEKRNAPTVSTKYSVAKRNKLARAEANRARVAAQSSEKALGKFVDRLPVLVAQLKKEDKAAAKERVRIAHLKETQPDRDPRLGKFVEQEAFPDVALTEELPEAGALRSIKPSSQLVKDQFTRFQERHLIETRKKVKATRSIKGRSYDRFKNDPKEATKPV